MVPTDGVAMQCMSMLAAESQHCTSFMSCRDPARLFSDAHTACTPAYQMHVVI